MNANIDLTRIVLRTPRLLLRSFQKEDLKDFFSYASVPGVGEMAGWKHHENMEESKKILDEFISGKKTFAIVDAETNHVIGSLGLENLTQSFYTLSGLSGREIGYVLRKDDWGKGLMDEAVKAVIQFCFSSADMDFLAVSHFLMNHQSQRVIEKCGFTPDGEFFFKGNDGTIQKAKYYSLLNPNKELEKNW